MLDEFRKSAVNFQQLLPLATVPVFNPNTFETNLHIDLAKVYEGLAYAPDPDIEARHTQPDGWNARFNISARYKMLKEAQQSPGFIDDAPVAIPYRKNGGICSPSEIFDLICQSDNYPYYRNDMKTIDHYKDNLVTWLDDRVIYEPCGGNMDKLARILKYMAEAGKAPRLVICNDTEQEVLRDMRDKIGLITDDMRVKGTRQKVPVITMLGDWMDENTYRGSSIVAQMGKAGISSSHNGNLLSFLRYDPAKKAFFMPGMTANDFNLQALLKFLNGNFNAGTIFIVSFDLTTNPKALAHNYADHALVRQLVQTGIMHSTHAYWTGRNIANEMYDPRYVGVGIKPLPWGKDMNVDMFLFNKLWPEQRLHITPIVKMEEHRLGMALDACGMENIGYMKPADDRDEWVKAEDPFNRTISAMVAFCHKGHKQPLLDAVSTKSKPPTATFG